MINKYLVQPRIVTRPIRLQKVKEFLKPTLWDYKIKDNRGIKTSWVFTISPNKGKIKCKSK